MFDANGRYEIEIPEEGTYKVVASAIGFKALEKSVKVDGPGVFRLDFMLSANTEQLKEVVVLSGRDVNKVDRTVAKIPLTNMENPQIYNTVSSEIMKQQGFDAQPVLYNGLPGLTSGNLEPEIGRAHV